MPQPETRDYTHRRRGVVRLSSLFAIILVACGNPKQSESSKEVALQERPIPNGLCNSSTPDELLHAIEGLEAEGGLTPIADRPWIRTCVVSRMDQLSPSVAEFCEKHRSLSESDPTRSARDSSLRSDLIFKYRDLAAQCRSMQEGNDVETISREWCWDIEQTLNRFEGIARNVPVEAQKLECLHDQRAVFLGQLKEACSRGWKSKYEGPDIMRRWYEECGVARQ